MEIKKVHGLVKLVLIILVREHIALVVVVLVKMIVLHAILIIISTQENVCLLVRMENMEIQQHLIAKTVMMTVLLAMVLMIVIVLHAVLIIILSQDSAKAVILTVLHAMVLLVMIVLHAVLIIILITQENVCLLVIMETMENHQQILAKPALMVVSYALMEILVIHVQKQDIIKMVQKFAKTVMMTVLLAMVLVVMIVLHAVLIIISSQDNV